MKLAIVRQRYDPYGGAERFIAAAAAELEKADVELTVIAREWIGDITEGRWLKCDPFYVGRVWRDQGFARAVCEATSRGNFDLVQSHERIACCDIFRAGDGVHAQWLELRAAALRGVRRWWLGLSPFHRHLLMAERTLFSSNRLRAVICNSQFVRDDIIRRFGVSPNKVQVIPNGVDLERFHPRRADRRGELLANLGVPIDAKVLLFVGSGFERKGVGTLLEGFARLEASNAYVLIIGKDKSQAKYREQARALGVEGRVRWLGGQGDVAPWYGCADTFVLPTIYDPFPNAALEALASGVPIVVSRYCGAAEVVRDGWNGYVCFNPLDAAELSIKLGAILESSESLRDNARASAEPFAMEKMAAALLNLYCTLLSQGR